MSGPTTILGQRFRRSWGSLVAVLFHLAADSEWHEGETYDRSMPGVALADVGFVHCSYADQLAATAVRYYADRTDLVLLTIDPDKLSSPVRVEDGFPHVYGPLDPDAVVGARPWATTSPDRPA